MKEAVRIFSTPILETNGDKARAAAKLGEFLEQLRAVEYKIRHPGNLALHELKHALADSGPGQFLVDLTYIPGQMVMGWYVSVGFRTPEQRLKILEAPGGDMSRYDRTEVMLLFLLNPHIFIKRILGQI